MAWGYLGKKSCTAAVAVRMDEIMAESAVARAKRAYDSGRGWGLGSYFVYFARCKHAVVTGLGTWWFERRL